MTLTAAPLTAIPWTAFALLAIDFGHIITLLVLLASFVIWLVNQINSNAEQAEPEAEEDDEADELMREAIEAQRRQQRTERLGQRTSQAMHEDDEDDWESPVGVSEHVAEHMDTHAFDDRSLTFGQLTQLDDTVDDHIHAVFDHTVGSLGQTPRTASGPRSVMPPATATAAAGIALILSRPEHLRNAIVMQEILKRPEWDSD